MIGGKAWTGHLRPQPGEDRHRWRERGGSAGGGAASPRRICQVRRPAPSSPPLGDVPGLSVEGPWGRSDETPCCRRDEVSIDDGQHGM